MREHKTTPMREIGYHIKAEQEMSDEDIAWVVAMAQAILRAFCWDQGQPMRRLAESLKISPQTLYNTLRLVVAAMMWVRRKKKSVWMLVERVERLAHVEQTYHLLQGEEERLRQALKDAQEKKQALQDEVRCLRALWSASLRRLIVVLKMEGRCTVRSIVGVLRYGLDIDVSVGYVQGVIAEAGEKAHSVLEKLLQVIPLSGAVCIDECFFKEMGLKILGIVIVDPLSGLILRLERCTERSADAIGKVLEHFNQAGFKVQIKLCLTDMYKGYLEPVKTYLPQAVHQFCWFHINCFHIGATVRQAKRAYEQAIKALDTFDKKRRTRSGAERQRRLTLVTTRDQAAKHWQGALRFQRLLTRLLWSPTLTLATARLDQLIRVAPRVENAYVRKMGAFLSDHRTGLLAFFACLESGRHKLQRLSRSRQQWVPLTARWAMPITSNAAEHVFRCLRRYTNAMDHFGTKAATHRFFDLFVFYHNVHILRAGKHAGQSLLAAARVNVIDAFGSDDPFTMLGFTSLHAGEKCPVGWHLKSHLGAVP